MSSSKTILLKSSDGETFEVDEAVAFESETLKDMIKDMMKDTSITLPNITSKTLLKVIEYCKKHVDKTNTEEVDLKSFDSDFVKVDHSTLFAIILAASYLKIKGLTDLTCQAVANIIKEKATEALRATFNITNDFTPEEQEEVRRENSWRFE